MGVFIKGLIGSRTSRAPFVIPPAIGGESRQEDSMGPPSKPTGDDKYLTAGDDEMWS